MMAQGFASQEKPAATAAVQSAPARMRISKNTYMIENIRLKEAFENNAVFRYIDKFKRGNQT
jgi:hypothetical protein